MTDMKLYEENPLKLYVYSTIIIFLCVLCIFLIFPLIYLFYI